ncbi:hypothetical protein QQZ08_009687 [Neonectria magnoliae]|uniref:Aminoglycoside phosphotransferase domain-containing protein n=1 Tax=Neonectria magnoliae TaxID=2732573 RepID=A0ABR1HLF7_9HYPO
MTAKHPISPANLLAVASELRGDGAPAQLCFGTEDAPIQDGQSWIYAVQFPDATTWAFRMFAPTTGGFTPDSISSIVKDEMRFLGILQNAGFRWSPKLIGGDHSFKNTIGRPYLVVSWIPGTALDWSPSIPADHQVRRKVLRQLLDIQLELVNLTKESRPGTTTREYLSDIIAGKIGRASNGSLPELDIRSCLVQRALLPYAVHEGLQEPFFAIEHGHLAPHKIIVDSEHNITGIIDWMLARYRPVQLALQFPRILEHDELEESRPSAPTIEFIQPSPSILADRQVILSELTSIIAEDPGRASVASAMKVIWSDEGADWQHSLIRACFSKTLHKWLAERSWLSGVLRTSGGNQINLPSDETIEEEMRQLSSNATD